MSVRECTSHHVLPPSLPPDEASYPAWDEYNEARYRYRYGTWREPPPPPPPVMVRDDPEDIVVVWCLLLWLFFFFAFLFFLTYYP